ncbi:MAG: tetratricopeptide repeat protein, partial [Flavobacteriaceae bacterium]|nr:tetratricopeptide repeat protein [Flavobacteriaceae bacterium]
YPEDLLNMSGYMNMDMQQPEKAKIYFELAVQYYPNSSNVYDSLADYYQSENNYKEALKNVEKAYQLNPTNYFKEKIEQLKNKL